MIAAAATHGKVRINNVIPKHLESVAASLKKLRQSRDARRFRHCNRLRKIRKTTVKTLPYPGFPTDLHPQFAALLSVAPGVSYITETIWPKRFRYINELNCMGASIKVDGNTAIIEGVPELSSACVKAVDLRAGCSVLIAGLMAKGKTEIYDIKYIERGYDDIVTKLSGLGANIMKVYVPEGISAQRAN